MSSKPTADSRREEFARMRKAGFSYRDIGAKHGVSYERVRQVLMADGSDPGTWKRATARSKRDVVRSEMAAWLEENGPVTREEFFARYPMKPSRFVTLVHEGLPSHLILSVSRNVETVFSDEDVHAALRRAWGEVQRLNPSAAGLSHVMYERVRRLDEPSAALVVARFGWAAVCAAAGVPDGGTSRSKASYTSAWSDDDILDAVGRYVRACMDEGVRPSYLGYERFQQDRSDAPSGTLVRNRMRALGIKTWPDIVQAAAARARKRAA